MRKIAVLGVLFATIGLTACSSTSSPGGAPASRSSAIRTAAGQSIVMLKGTSGLQFLPSTIPVHGLTVKVRFVDTSSYPHNLEVPALHFTSATVNGEIGGKKSTTFSLHFPHAGTYWFECAYHASAGMRGKFVVTAGD
jgi:plastocyanin